MSKRDVAASEEAEATQARELSEDELEVVAGGYTPTWARGAIARIPMR